MTGAHRGSTASAPSRDARQERHSAGGSAVCVSFGPGPVPGLCPDDRAARRACGPGGAAARTPAALAVLAALPLGLLPRFPGLFRPDPLLRARRARVRAVHRQPALQLRDPQLQPAPQLPLARQRSQRRLQACRQRRDLLVLCPHDSPQPRNQVTLLAACPRAIRHEPQACSTCAESSTTSARGRVAAGVMSRTQQACRPGFRRLTV